MFDHSRSWFHWRDGLYFQRQEDGSVVKDPDRAVHHAITLVFQTGIHVKRDTLWHQSLSTMA